MLKEYGYVRVGSAVNKLELANIDYNVEEILSVVNKADKNGVEILTFPNLSLTGYTVKDLLLSDDLINNSLKGLIKLKKESKKYKLIFIVGAPLLIDNNLYNCAISIQNGKILGVTVKENLDEYESRYFKSGKELNVSSFIIDNQEVMVSNLLLYKSRDYSYIKYGVSLDNELDYSFSTFDYLSAMGANLVLNLACSNELVTKKEERVVSVKHQAKRNLVGIVYASSGVNESSSENCYIGHLIISDEEGNIKENNRFNFDSKIIYDDLDLLKINNKRKRNHNLKNLYLNIDKEEVSFDLVKLDNQLIKEYDKTPLSFDNDSYLEEILNIQTYGLARRIKQLNKAKMVIGVSGGSDSTLAFLICLRVAKVLKMSTKDIIGVTMRGFGTSGRTYSNACKLINSSKVTLRDISIKDACLQHYKDIGHDIDNYNVTYENAQARERTQILFDIANDENGIVVGTGDLSELVLGWATYNGDHMSNYSVNSNIAKTLVLKLISKIASESKGKLKEVLNDILNTPITPELLPLDDKGNLVQDSQKSIGPYKLHDFFIYHFLGYGASVKKLYYLALHVFKDEYSKEEIKATLIIFIKRFFTQQFKRNCLPDGVRVMEISVTGDCLNLVSDLSYKTYLEQLEEL